MGGLSRSDGPLLFHRGSAAGEALESADDENGRENDAEEKIFFREK